MYVELFLKNLNAHQGFHPRQLGPPPNAILPEQVIGIIALVGRGGKVGQARSPPHLPCPGISYPDERNSPELIFP